MITIRWAQTEARRYVQTHDWTDEEILYGIHAAAQAAYDALRDSIAAARLDGTLTRARCPGCGGSGARGVGHCQQPRVCAVCQCRACGGSGLRGDLPSLAPTADIDIEVDVVEVVDVSPTVAEQTDAEIEAMIDAFTIQPDDGA